MTKPDLDTLSRREVATLFAGFIGGSMLPGCTRESPAQNARNADSVSTALTAGARLVMASAIGIAPSNSATTNSAAYVAWRDDDSDVDGDVSKSTTLVFDNPGTYSFNHQTLRVPENRKLTAVHGVTLKCETSGPTGSWFVTGSGAHFSLEDLTLDANSKVDFALLVAGTATVPGPRASVKAVVAKNANQACIRGFNSVLELHASGTAGGPVGLLLEACAGSGGNGIFASNHSQYAVRVRGAFGDASLPNDGGVTLSRVSCGGTNGCGLAFDGVAGAAVHTAILTGITQAAIRIVNKSSNVSIFGTRLLSGTAVDFDGCNNCYVWGGCVSTMKVAYRGDARSCRAFLIAESAVAPVDILQEWGTSAWPGYVRTDGSVLANSEPTDGYWERGDKVFRKTPALQQPLGWVCTQSGNPNHGVGPGQFEPMPPL